MSSRRFWRRMLGRAWLTATATVLCAVTANGTPDIAILSFPVGLVVGEQTIEIRFDAADGPADLYLDGIRVCSPTAEDPQCRVDFGVVPQVHLLEIVQRNQDGDAIAAARRWINRPGQEAELAIRLDQKSAGGICGGQVQWLHPDKSNPIVLDVTENGRPLLIGDDHRSFRFPCPDAGEPQVVAASAIFPDGRRAESVVLSGAFGGATGTSLTATALVAAENGVDPCEASASVEGGGFAVVENAGFEVVFVLDPTANYQALVTSGWSTVRRPTGSSVNVNPDFFLHQSGSGGSVEPKNSWKRAVSSLISADKMWFVLPDERLQRANGFSRGREGWLELLFQRGSIKPDTPLRVADGVAASGLVAAAGPRRRAVVLILGKTTGRDDSVFSPQNAQDYLSEIGVPLFVLRNGKPQDDGWPRGMQIKNMETMADALESFRNELDQQCVAWFEGDVDPVRISSALPAGIAIAGQRNEVVETDVEELQVGAVAEDRSQSAVPPLEARVDVTAVTVLVTARDSNGKPLTNLVATDIGVTEDGQPATVLDLQPVPRITTRQETGQSEAASAQPVPTPTTDAGGLPVAVFVDLEFSGAADTFAALDLLEDRSGWLASVGPVSVVEAGNGLRTILEGSRDAEQIRGALHDLVAASQGPGRIEQIRSRFLRENGPMRDQGASSNTSEEGLIPSVRFAIYEEDLEVRRHLNRILSWAVAESGEKPGLLFVVGAGFDEDPREFYLPTVERRSPEDASKVNLESRDLSVRRSQWVENLGKELAADGWLVVPVVGRSVGLGGSSIAAEQSGRGHLNEFFSDRGSGIGTFTPPWLLVEPLGSQRHLAGPSGGDVILSSKDLDALADQSSGWYRMTYQVDRPVAGVYRELDVSTARDDIVVQTTGVVLSGTSEQRSEARLLRLFDGPGPAGELPVEVAISEPYPGDNGAPIADATLTVSFAPIAPLFVDGRERPLRFSIAVKVGDEDPVVHHELEMAVGSLGGMHFEFPIEWSVPPEVLAVVVEDLNSGAWGSSVVDLSSADR